MGISIETSDESFLFLKHVERVGGTIMQNAVDLLSKCVIQASDVLKLGSGMIF